MSIIGIARFDLESSLIFKRYIRLFRWSQPYDHVVIQTAQGRRLGNINIGSQFSETILNRTPNAESDRPHIAGLIMREHLQTILKNAVPAEQIELNKELGMQFILHSILS